MCFFDILLSHKLMDKEKNVPCSSRKDGSDASSSVSDNSVQSNLSPAATEAVAESTKENRSSCLSLPEFLNRESKPEFEGLSPTNRTESDLILPALGLQRRGETLTLSSAADAAATAESLSDTTQFVTERIDHPIEILDTLKNALLARPPRLEKNKENSEDLKILVETHIKQRQLTAQVSQDCQPTDIIRLQKLAQSHQLECDLWAKCEFQNLSGSSKFRVASMMLKELEESGQISSTGTIITHTSSSFTLALACANVRMQKGYRLMTVLPDRVSRTKKLILRKMNVKIFRAPEESSDNDISPESPTMLAKFLHTKIQDSVLLDPFQDPWSVQTHVLWTGPEILSQFDDDKEKIDMVVCGFETGGMISGLSTFFKSVNEKCIVIGSDLSGHLVNKNPNFCDDRPTKLACEDPDTIYMEDYCSPLLSNVLNLQAVDKWYKISPKEASNMAHQTVAKEGIPVSASSGAVLLAAVEAARDFGLADKKEAKILIILDNFALYTDYDLASKDWLVSRNYLTHTDIESTTWYHQMYCWRIPLKVPVTVFNDFNASAVHAMMHTDGTDRVVVQDAKTNAVIGISCRDSLQKKLREGKLTSEDLIGSHHSVCTSFKIICINNNLSALLELFKTHTFALLVQRQKFVSARLGRMEQDWIAGILRVQDVVRFISDIERRHAEKFRMNLCGGFYRAKPPPSSSSLSTIKKNQEDPLDDFQSSSSSNKMAIGQHLKETIVMTLTAESTLSKSTNQVEADKEEAEELAGGGGIGTPSAVPMLDFVDPDSEFPLDSSPPPSMDSSVPGIIPESSVIVGPPLQSSNPGGAPVTPNFQTPVSYSSILDSDFDQQRQRQQVFPLEPTRFNSVALLDDDDNDADLSSPPTINLSSEISSESFPNNNVYNNSNMELSESIISAWYTSEGTAIAAAATAAAANLAPRQPSSSILMDTSESDSISSSELSSNVLIPIPNIPSSRMYGMPRPNTVDCSNFGQNGPTSSSSPSSNIHCDDEEEREKKEASKFVQESLGNKKPKLVPPKTAPTAAHPPPRGQLNGTATVAESDLPAPVFQNNVPVAEGGPTVDTNVAVNGATTSSRHDSLHSVFRIAAADIDDSTGSIMTDSTSLSSVDFDLNGDRRNLGVRNSQATNSIRLAVRRTTTMMAMPTVSKSQQSIEKGGGSSSKK